MIPTLRQACEPRASVFSTNTADTVYNLDQIDSIPVAEFFAENYVTSGMQTLLKEAFSRMDGSNPDANGAFLLSQSMGGGKTHSLLALGLLAKHPDFRESVMGSFHQVAPSLGPVQVVSFNGRQNPEYGLWGELAEQLGRGQIFSKFYSPLRAPGESDWVALLQGEPVLVLIDELPPYLNGALQVALGQSTLAHATQTALANLLAAINSGKLPNVTLVLTDLSGSSYSLANDRLSDVLGDMEKEAERTVQPIHPVRLDTTELYDILRKRLFVHLPDEAVIDDIADAFRSSIDDAGKILDVPTDRAGQIQSGIRQTYPFHPAMQDIFARFRENQGYQQTRALIRIMRLVVAQMWESGLADSRYLIGVQDVDFANARLASELEKINDRFGNAIAHDLTQQGGTAVAQVIDSDGEPNAQDAARLILMSSLSLATNPVLGLPRADIITFLAAPERNIGNLHTALNELQDQAWYLHATATGNLLFRTTENVRARLESSVKNVNNDNVRNAIAKKVEELYKPALRDVYQHVEALPDLNELTNTQDRTVLIIARPASGDLLREYYDSLKYKNRVLFVTSRPEEYETAVLRMRYLIATEQMVKEFEQSGYRANDPQLVEARELVTTYQSNFYQALRQAFFTLLSPGNKGLLSAEFDPIYDQNNFQGENVIRESLISRHQYIAPGDMLSDEFRTRLETQLWPAGNKQVAWTLIREEAAQTPGFPLHQPGKLDDVRAQAVQRGQWRLIDGGKFVERGPFEAEKARVAPPQPIGSPDPTTGAVTLKVAAVNADQVKFIAADGTETLVQGGQIILTDLKGEFVAIDTTGVHESEPPLAWQNTITIRYALQVGADGQRQIKLEAVPPAQIRYTIDGTSPLHGGVAYGGPFPIGNAKVTVLAMAEQDGVQSIRHQFQIPEVAGKVTVDPGKKARLTRTLDATSTKAVFDLLAELEKQDAMLRGVELNADDGSVHYASWSVDPETTLTVEQVRTMADQFTTFHPGWDLRLNVEKSEYETGADLLATLSALNEGPLQPDELEQYG